MGMKWNLKPFFFFFQDGDGVDLLIQKDLVTSY